MDWSTGHLLAICIIIIIMLFNCKQNLLLIAWLYVYNVKTFICMYRYYVGDMLLFGDYSKAVLRAGGRTPCRYKLCTINELKLTKRPPVSAKDFNWTAMLSTMCPKVIIKSLPNHLFIEQTPVFFALIIWAAGASLSGQLSCLYYRLRVLAPKRLQSADPVYISFGFALLVLIVLLVNLIHKLRHK